MIGFVYRHVSYVANVFCEERQSYSVYHLKMVNYFPHVFTGTLILKKTGNEFNFHSPSSFENKELLNILINALQKQEMAEQ